MQYIGSSGDENISMVRGDTMSFGLEIEGLEQDLDTAFFTVKNNYASDTKILQKSLGDGVTQIDDNLYIVRLAPNDTRYIDAGIYYYDFEIGVNGDVFTLLKGALTLEQDITT